MKLLVLVVVVLFVASNQQKVDGRTFINYYDTLNSNRDDLRDVEIGSEQSACIQSYSPCTCNVTADGINVLCVDVTGDQVKAAFMATTDASIYKFQYYRTTAGASALPVDVLSDKKATIIQIGCPHTDGSCATLTLDVDVLAFRFTRRNTVEMHLTYVDMSSQTSFGFLDGFDVLSTLRIDHYRGIGAFGTLPQLPGLKLLTLINGDKSLDGVVFPDLTPASLQSFNLDNNYLGDNAVNNILIALSGSSSANTIEYLALKGNNLVEVPRRLPSFYKLNWLDLNSNQIATITRSRLLFSVPPSYIDLANNVITVMENGTFSGEFSMAKVFIFHNSLNSFAEGVFKPVLEQMVAANVGSFVEISSNPFECGCGLAWLLRDNRHLMPAVSGGVCNGIIKLEDVSPDSFTNCP